MSFFKPNPVQVICIKLKLLVSSLSYWSVALMPSVVFVDSCSQLVRCVWNTNTLPSSPGKELQLYTTIKQCVYTCLFGRLNVCTLIPLICMLHEDCGQNECWHHAFCLNPSVCCHFLSIGVFNWINERLHVGVSSQSCFPSCLLTFLNYTFFITLRAQNMEECIVL